MRFSTESSPHIALDTSVPLIMRRLLLALVPGTLALFWFFGVGVVTNVLLAVAFCVGAEAAILALRGHSLRLFLGDSSAIVTGWLLALALPPLSPWWLILVASFFAIVVAKQLYGGLGYNPFNPAMVGYVVALISFPVDMTSWISATDPGPSLITSLAVVFGGDSLGQLDGVTAATALDAAKTQVALGRMVSEFSDGPAFGLLGAVGTEWAAVLFLAGGVWMIGQGVTNWQIPVSTLGGLFVIAFFFWLLDSEVFASPVFHLFSGGTMLGAFFIATDPVSASTTPRGRLVFGAGIGILVYIIRTWGGYPDGVAFAVLLMNLMAPTIDHYTRPRVYGHGAEG